MFILVLQDSGGFYDGLNHRGELVAGSGRHGPGSCQEFMIEISRHADALHYPALGGSFDTLPHCLGAH